MVENIIFWIGALSIGLNTIRFTWCLTSVFLGWMLKKLEWEDHYLYFYEVTTSVETPNKSTTGRDNN